MSSPNNTSTSSRENAAAGADEKPRLTEEEKKQNHIASGMVPHDLISPPAITQDPVYFCSAESMLHACIHLDLSIRYLFFLVKFYLFLLTCLALIEQKRRQAIREGFDRLTELVPGLEGQGRSEGLVLKRTVEYMRQQMQERRALIERIEQSGGHVDDELKKLVCSSLNPYPHLSHSTSTGRANAPKPKSSCCLLSRRRLPSNHLLTRVLNEQTHGRSKG